MVGNYAAQVCANYQGGNYGDWYLPSLYECNLIFQNIGDENSGLGNPAGLNVNGYYWSSSEIDVDAAWRVHLYYGMEEWSGKQEQASVRAIRAF